LFSINQSINTFITCHSTEARGAFCIAVYFVYLLKKAAVKHRKLHLGFCCMQGFRQLNEELDSTKNQLVASLAKNGKYNC